MRFTLAKQRAKIAHLNFRQEMHGDEPVLAVDVKVEADVTNDFLSELSPTLKWSLYDKAEDVQGSLVAEAGHMPRLRYPDLGALKWAGKMEGVEFVLQGLAEKKGLALTGALDKLRLECKEGGTVAISWSAAVRPTEAQSAKMAGMLGQDVLVSVSGGTAAAETPDSGE